MIKKIPLLTLMSLTMALQGAFVMTKGKDLKKTEISLETTQTTQTTQRTQTTQTTQSSTSPISLAQYNYTPRALPSKNTWNDVTKHKGIVCDGVHDDTAGFKNLIKDTSVTNWYIAPDKTCKFFDIKVQPHLKAVFGGGKIIVKGNTKHSGHTSHTGVFLLHSNIDGFLIDNIDFAVDTEGWGEIALWYNSGIIELADTKEKHNKNIEIRNCNVDVEGYPMNFVQGYLNQNTPLGINNLIIINNTIRGFKQFAIEILGGHGRKPESRPAKGFKILRNKFIGSKTSKLRRCISLVGLDFGKHKTETYVAENWFVDVEWGMELSSSSGINVANNLFTGKTLTAWHDMPEVGLGATGKFSNHYYHNVITPNPTATRFETPSGATFNGSYLEMGNASEMYENYIGTQLRANKIPSINDSNLKGLNVHDNIFSILGAEIVEMNYAIIFDAYNPQLSTFKNNTVYMNPNRKIFNKRGSNFSNNKFVDSRPSIPKNWGPTVDKSKIGAQ